MTFRQSTQAAQRAPAIAAQDGVSLVQCIGEYVVEAGLANGDIIEMIAHPASHALSGTHVVANQVDSNGAPTLAFDVGYLSDDWLMLKKANGSARTIGQEFGAGLTTIGRAAGGTNLDVTNAATKLADATTNDRSIGLKLTGGAATLVVGSKIRMYGTFTPVPVGMTSGF